MAPAAIRKMLTPIPMSCPLVEVGHGDEASRGCLRTVYPVALGGTRLAAPPPGTLARQPVDLIVGLEVAA